MASQLTRIHDRIRVNNELLISELQVSPLIDHLFGKGALTTDDVERIEAEVTTHDKARRFLKIMTHKSEDVILRFVEKLKEPNCQPHLAEAVLKTEVSDEVSRLAVNPVPSITLSAKFPACMEMKKWSVDEVCRWLKKLDMDQKVIACFREQKISGDILVTLKKKDIVEFGPDIVYGDRIKLIKLRDIELAKLRRQLVEQKLMSIFVNAVFVVIMLPSTFAHWCDEEK